MFFFLSSPDIYSSILGLFLNYSSYNIWLDCGCAGSHCLMNEPLAFCRWCYQQLFECCMFTCIYPALWGKGWSLTQGKRECYCDSSKVSGTALPGLPPYCCPASSMLGGPGRCPVGLGRLSSAECVRPCLRSADCNATTAMAVSTLLS